MSLREEALDRVFEAKMLLKQVATSSLALLLIAILDVGALAVVVPIAVGINGVATWRYVRAQRELAAIDKPPTARLLR